MRKLRFPAIMRYQQGPEQIAENLHLGLGQVLHEIGANPRLEHPPGTGQIPLAPRCQTDFDGPPINARPVPGNQPGSLESIDHLRHACLRKEQSLGQIAHPKTATGLVHLRKQILFRQREATLLLKLLVQTTREILADMDQTRPGEHCCVIGCLVGSRHVCRPFP